MRAANDGSPAKGGGVYGSGSGLEKIRQAKASLAEVAKKERKQAKGALEERVRALESQLASSRETAARRMGEAEETIAKLKAALKRSRRQAEENEAEGAARNRELRRTLAEAKCEASKEVEGVGEEMTVALAKWRRRSKRAEAALSSAREELCEALRRAGQHEAASNTQAGDDDETLLRGITALGAAASGASSSNRVTAAAERDVASKQLAAARKQRVAAETGRSAADADKERRALEEELASTREQLRVAEAHATVAIARAQKTVARPAPHGATSSLLSEAGAAKAAKGAQAVAAALRKLSANASLAGSSAVDPIGMALHALLDFDIHLLRNNKPVLALQLSRAAPAAIKHFDVGKDGTISYDCKAPGGSQMVRASCQAWRCCCLRVLVYVVGLVSALASLVR